MIKVENRKRGVYIMEDKVIVSSEKMISSKSISFVVGVSLAIAIFGGAFLEWASWGFDYFHLDNVIYFSWVGALFLIPGLFVLFFNKSRITVYEKHIEGRTLFGEEINLPVDLISSVSNLKFSYGVKVATSSGKIQFVYLEKNQDVYNAIKKLLIERQDKSRTSTITNQTKQEKSEDPYEQIKKLKDLLDTGAITADEYEKKKKQLLDL